MKQMSYFKLSLKTLTTGIRDDRISAARRQRVIADPCIPSNKLFCQMRIGRGNRHIFGSMVTVKNFKLCALHLNPLYPHKAIQQLGSEKGLGGWRVRYDSLVSMLQIHFHEC